VGMPRRTKVGGQVQGSGWRFDAKNEMAQAYAGRQAARYVTRVSAETKAGLQGIIGKSIREGITARNTAKLIKSSVGLNGPQGAAVNTYYNKMIARGTDPGRAWKLADKYSDKLLKARAKTIARTETMGALNGGALEQARQRRDAGLYLNPMKKWKITADEVTCTVCRPLEGQVRPLEGTFSTGVSAPPAHPNCRCTLSFFEAEAIGDQQARLQEIQVAKADMFAGAPGTAEVRHTIGMPGQLTVGSHETSLSAALNDHKASMITYHSENFMWKGQKIKFSLQLDQGLSQNSFVDTIGRRTTMGERLKAVGFHIPDGVKQIIIKGTGQEMSVRILGTNPEGWDSIHMERIWGASRWGASAKLYQENSFFEVRGAFARKGFAREVMRRSIAGASEIGINELRLEAMGQLDQAAAEMWNGYYTWPRMGFDAPISPGAMRASHGGRSVLQAALKNGVITRAEHDRFRAWDNAGGIVLAKRQRSVQQRIDDELRRIGFDPTKDIQISELMKSETGRSLWKVYGGSLQMTFDLAPGSRSRIGLEAYLAAKK